MGPERRWRGQPVGKEEMQRVLPPGPRGGGREKKPPWESRCSARVRWTSEWPRARGREAEMEDL